MKKMDWQHHGRSEAEQLQQLLTVCMKHGLKLHQHAINF